MDKKIHITLEQAKRHCNIELSYGGDDTYLYDLIAVAEKVYSKDICEDLSALEDEDGNLPDDSQHAILLLVGNFYNNREPVSFAQPHDVPLSYKHLVGLNRNYSK